MYKHVLFTVRYTVYVDTNLWKWDGHVVRWVIQFSWNLSISNDSFVKRSLIEFKTVSNSRAINNDELFWYWIHVWLSMNNNFLSFFVSFTPHFKISELKMEEKKYHGKEIVITEWKKKSRLSFIRSNRRYTNQSFYLSVHVHIENEIQVRPLIKLKCYDKKILVLFFKMRAQICAIFLAFQDFLAFCGSVDNSNFFK